MADVLVQQQFWNAAKQLVGLRDALRELGEHEGASSIANLLGIFEGRLQSIIEELEAAAKKLDASKQSTT